MGIVSRLVLPEPLPLGAVVLRAGEAPPWPATPASLTASLPADRLSEGLDLEPKELRLFDRQGLLLLHALRRTDGSPAAVSRAERASMPVHLAVGPARTDLATMRKWARRLSPGEPLPTVQPAAAVGLLPNTPLSLLSIHGALTGEGAVWTGFSEAGFHALAGVVQALVDGCRAGGRAARDEAGRRAGNRAEDRAEDRCFFGQAPGDEAGGQGGGQVGCQVGDQADCRTHGRAPGDEADCRKRCDDAQKVQEDHQELFSAVGLVAAVDSIGNHFVQDLWKHGWAEDPGEIPETAILLRVGGPASRGAMGLRGLFVGDRGDGVSCLLDAAEAVGRAAPVAQVSSISPGSLASFDSPVPFASPVSTVSPATPGSPFSSVPPDSSASPVSAVSPVSPASPDSAMLGVSSVPPVSPASPASSVSPVSSISTDSSASQPGPDFPALRLLAEGFDGRHDLTSRCGPALTTLLPLAIAAVLDDPFERQILALRGRDGRPIAVLLERIS